VLMGCEAHAFCILFLLVLGFGIIILGYRIQRAAAFCYTQTTSSLTLDVLIGMPTEDGCVRIETLPRLTRI
jgi:hypothetical protein